jgi:hypothetical protein
MNPNAKFKALVEEINVLKKELTAKAKQGLMSCLIELFQQHPEVKSLQFAAYTPYFNDGDECTYWCTAHYATVNNDYNEDDQDVSKSVADIFRDALAQLDNETWKQIVGDHALVTITPQGINIAEYDHE